uniref:Transmembrane protein 231 n=1 Tax=Parascaris equorum TaxID=6256 RepID=A0A914RN94_PAREQ
MKVVCRGSEESFGKSKEIYEDILLNAEIFQGMWKKYGEYSEQPSVQFKNRYIIMLKGASIDDYFLWSTYPVLNQAEHSRLRIPVIEATTIDYNDDGKTDLQSIPLRSFGWDLNHGGPLINESNPDFFHYAPVEIMLRNSLRNFTTTLKREVVMCSSKSMEKNSFVIRFSIRIPEQKLTYKSGLFELLKFAWMQYLIEDKRLE